MSWSVKKLFNGAKRILSACDFVLVGLVLLLCVLGVFILGSIYYNAAPAMAGQVGTAFRSQIMWLASGVFVLIFMSLIDYQWICRFYIPLAAISMIMLVVVFLIPPMREGLPQRWLHVPGFSPTLQPSEFSKIFMLIFFAKFIDRMQDRINSPLVILTMVVMGLVPVFLIFIQPSLSASILQLSIFVVMIFMSGIKYKYIFIAIAIILPIAGFLVFDIFRDEHILVHRIFEPFQLENRIKPRFGLNVTPDITHQSEMSVRAIGSGALFGRGFGENAVTVPLAHNDFIFSTIGAEFGFIGSVIVILIYFVIVVKCYIAAHRANSPVGRLLAAGVGTMIGVQTFVHVGVTTWLLPNTGIPLPFISAGGSSMWINLAAVGIVVNIGMKPMRKHLFWDK